MKKTTSAKTAQVGTESRPISTEEPRTQVQHTTGETEKETAAASAISKGKDQRELRKRKGTSMRKRVQPELQNPATTETDSESESERESDSLEKSDEDGEEEEDESSSENTKKTLRQIMHKLEKLNALKVIKEKITKMEAMFDKMTKKQEKMEKKITDLEVKVEEMDGRMKKMEDDNDAWTSERKQLVGKIEKTKKKSQSLVGNGNNTLELLKQNTWMCPMSTQHRFITGQCLWNVD
ncbi:protein FAM133-like isoform X2 [Hypanus sabinus]|uniref:protein FAM133-like isoform X2 n=1 Tax=Hypanus sabinus TaxID=79690 RepID=UPI0028C3F185|nr:protein FAM133-like isoform X2 [Hypanus sabinus]